MEYAYKVPFLEVHAGFADGYWIARRKGRVGSALACIGGALRKEREKRKEGGVLPPLFRG